MLVVLLKKRIITLELLRLTIRYQVLMVKLLKIRKCIKKVNKRFGFCSRSDGSQAYLIFQLIHRYVKIIDNTRYISEWKSKGLSDKSIKPFPTSDNSLIPLIDYYGYEIRVKFNGSILRKPKISYTHEKAVTIYIVYELAASSSYSDDPMLKSCLFGAVVLTKNADIDKYGYSGYGIGFDKKSSF